MSWQQSDTWQWWLSTGFDGIGGGVIGGLVTGGAVWLTLRRDRAIRAEDRKRDDDAQTRAAVAHLRVELNRLRFGVPHSKDESPLIVLIWLRRMQEEITATMAAVRPGSPALAKDLERASDMLDSCVAADGYKVDLLRGMAISGKVINGVHAWQLDPKNYAGAMGGELDQVDAPAPESDAGETSSE